MDLLFVSYIGVSILLAWVGRKTAIGPIMIFLTSIILTPVLPLVYILVCFLVVSPERRI